MKKVNFVHFITFANYIVSLCQFTVNWIIMTVSSQSSGDDIDVLCNMLAYMSDSDSGIDPPINILKYRPIYNKPCNNIVHGL